MKFYRGLNNIYLGEINHRHISDGYYGRATYYALNESGAEVYGTKGNKSQYICECSIEPQKILYLSLSDVKDLDHFGYGETLTVTQSGIEKLKQSSVKSTDLAKTAVELGYDAIILTGDVEGGEQLIIPENSSCEVICLRIKVKIWITTSQIAQSFADYLPTKLNVQIHHESGRNWVTIDASAETLKDLESELEFLERVNFSTAFNVDFNKRTFEDYDDCED